MDLAAILVAIACLVLAIGRYKSWLAIAEAEADCMRAEHGLIDYGDAPTPVAPVVREESEEGE